MREDPRETENSRKRDVSRRAHLRDFKQDENGEYHYEGRIVEAQVSEEGSSGSGSTEAFRELLRKMWKTAAVLVPALVVIGTLPPEVMGDRFYLLIPYVLEMIIVVRILWGLYRITAGGGSLREYQHQTAAARQPLRCRILAGCAGLSLVLGTLRLITASDLGRRGAMVLWLFMQAAILGSALLLGRMHNHLEWS